MSIDSLPSRHIPSSKRLVDEELSTLEEDVLKELDSILTEDVLNELFELIDGA